MPKTLQKRKSRPSTRTSADDLRFMIEHIVDQRLAEILGDPDAGLEIRPNVKARLLRQLRDREGDARAVPLKAVLKRYGME